MSKLNYYKDFEIFQFMEKAPKKLSDRLEQLMDERRFNYNPFDSQIINIEIESIIERIKKIPPKSLTIEEVKLKWAK